ncbi:MAG: ATP-dependent DNA helicase RecG [Actinobacteria bacterium]|nr:ATP-dependent DNA helicase RecG [Actinomycetota bacterium]
MMPSAPTLVDVVGPKTAKALGRLSITSVEELLRHYPRRYARRGELSDLASLRVGETVTVFAEIQSSKSRPLKQRGASMLEVVVTDGTGRLSLTFFRQGWREKQLTAGRRGMFSGKVTEFRGTRQLAHPEYVLAPFGDDIEPEAVAAFASEIIPIYSATSSLPSWRVAACVELALPHAMTLTDPVPDDLRRGRGLPDLVTALSHVHRPPGDEELSQAVAKLKFDEAFVLQAEMLRRRAENRAVTAVSRARAHEGLLSRFDAALPFPLTGSQVRVGEEIFDDLSRTYPMQRLLQGEVGSGKTLVALRAMLAVIDAGGQAVLLAPTEVLASQHFDSIRSLLGPLAGEGIVSAPGAVTVTLLTGSMSTPSRRQALLEIQSGTAGIVVGTHALIQDVVGFADLGLVVVDEQHRFGVDQRARLLDKAGGGMRPHQLVMTATPIPRTVAMTVFSDLDVSTLDELPPGRAPITTHVVSAAAQPRHLARVWERIREEVALGRKAYVVCPQIGDNASAKPKRSAAGADDTAGESEDADIRQLLP